MNPSPVYTAYKPLRNHLRQYNLQQSLEDVWMLFGHLSNKTPLPWGFGDGHPHRVRDYLFLWDLDIVARELVLHASPSGTLRIANFNSLKEVGNRIRDIENVSAKAFFADRGTGALNAFVSLYAVVHRQFPWQRKQSWTELMRYLKIFGEKEVEAVLQEGTGLSIREWYFMGMAVSGHLLREPGINAEQDYRSFGIPLERSKGFFKKLSIGADELRRKTFEAQRYDENWLYTWNPLEETPLVALDPAHPNRLHCPEPEFLLRRVSQGLYYDIVNVHGFANSFGPSFEAYVGVVVRETFSGIPFELMAETQYQVGLNAKHGTDWILTDRGANLFIECKTKRIRKASKMAFDHATVSGDVEVLASAIVQLYKNIADAVQAKTHWVPNGLPIHPLVVTLENWYLFGPALSGMLRNLVLEKLQVQRIDIAILETMPYTVMSTSELEQTSPVWARVGIAEFFSKKHGAEYRDWLPQDYAKDVFPDAWKASSRNLFAEDWERLFPEMKGGLKDI